MAETSTRLEDLSYEDWRGLLRRLYEHTYEGGLHGTCYGCPFASEPLDRRGRPEPWEHVANDPTEAYFRCSLPTRRDREEEVEWGEYAPCTEQEWFDALVPDDPEVLDIIGPACFKLPPGSTLGSYALAWPDEDDRTAEGGSSSVEGEEVHDGA